jgi:hypothetical protein
MKRPLPIALLLIILLVISFIVWDFFREKRRVSDDSFVMVENAVSPDGQHRILVYHYDQGAFGDSRAWWAITPPDYQYLDLTNYELPNCYETEGWLEGGELLISKREPCHCREKRVELKTGDVLMGVKTRVVLKSDLLREKGLEERMTISPLQPSL